MRCSPQWRDGRKLFHRILQPQVVQSYRPIRVAQTHNLLRRLLQTPERVLEHTKQCVSMRRWRMGCLAAERTVCSFVNAGIMSITYGIDVQEEKDPWIATGEHVMEAADRSIRPGTYLVDLIPLCTSPLSIFHG